VSHLDADIRARAVELVSLYPQPRSALIPLCHLAQEQDGYLHPEAMEEIAELCKCSAAEVRGTATFYDMLHTEPVGTYALSVCTNIACMLGGALEPGDQHVQIVRLVQHVSLHFAVALAPDAMAVGVIATRIAQGSAITEACDREQYTTERRGPVKSTQGQTGIRPAQLC